MNFRVQIFDSNGFFLRSFGRPGDATGCMARPKGVATDRLGNIYVADALFHVVQIFDYRGNYLYSFGKQGQGKGEFWMPAGIFVDEADNIYVADCYNSRIQVFHLNRMVRP
jgi:DNA-binding beta-propeller fold protein YncE